MKKILPGVKSEKTGMIPFLKQDQYDDRENAEEIKKKAGPKYVSKFKKEDEKADRKLVAKATKEGKSLAEIKKLDEAKDKKIIAKVTKGAKK